MSYEFEHAIECPVSRELAWRFWSHVENWAAVDSTVESVKLDGPFAGGTKGTTKPRGSSPNEWELLEVENGKRAVIGLSVPGAVLKFLWEFENEASGSGTLIRQRVILEGERADNYAAGMKELEAAIPEGMQNLVRGILRAAQEDA
ncbi:MAG TPA: SRPBCC family protein [Pyrinomonadaceae bacterium]|nr:SRPBCC family protein [Pyrinomonadaceae bacterium]